MAAHPATRRAIEDGPFRSRSRSPGRAARVYFQPFSLAAPELPLTGWSAQREGISRDRTCRAIRTHPRVSGVPVTSPGVLLGHDVRRGRDTTASYLWRYRRTNLYTPAAYGRLSDRAGG